MRTLIVFVFAMLSNIVANAQYVFHTLDMRKHLPVSFFHANEFCHLNGNIFLTSIVVTNQGHHTWITDGTNVGTTQLAFAGSNYTTLYTNNTPVINNVSTELALFKYRFINWSTAEYQIWITDGTKAGTKRLTTAVNQTMSSNSIAFKNKFYFLGKDTTYGEELWESDGTLTGTKLLIDIVPGKNNSSANPIFADSTRMFVYATTPAGGGELWCTDGTAAGTYMVKDINPGAGTSSPGAFVKFNNIYYFWANDGTNGAALWRTDATPAGTYMVKDINTVNTNSPYTYNGYAIANNLLFFAGNDGVHGSELWVTDGTANGTRMVKEINTTAKYSSGNANPKNLTTYNGEVYFSAQDSLHGAELWKTNGEASGTKMVKDICANAGSNPESFHLYKKHLFFTAQNPCGSNGDPKLREFYYTDGTAAGTIMIKPPTAVFAGGAEYIDKYIQYKDRLFFNADYSGDSDIWYLGDSILPVVTGIENIEAKDVSIYPNPAHHNFTIKTTTAFKTGRVTLTDVTGRVVKTQKLNTNIETISIEGITPGMYIADVWLDDKRSTQKLIVQ